MSAAGGPYRRLPVVCSAVLALVAASALSTLSATASPQVGAEPIGGERLSGRGVVVQAPSGVPAPPNVPDSSWVIADANTGAVLAAKAPHEKFLPASTVKALAALVMMPNVDASATMKATTDDAKVDGTRVGLVPDLPYTGDQLFHAMIMASANDATLTLARMNGGVARTAAEMNDLATLLGAHDTFIDDPTGLDTQRQRSSAYDLALIGRAAIANPRYLGYAKTPTMNFPGLVDQATKKRQTYAVANHNSLLHNYEGTIGVKNGYTVKAGRTFIAAVRRGGHTYLVTEMHSSDTSVAPTRQLLDWAFAHGSKVTPVGRLVAPGEVDERAAQASPSPRSTSGTNPPVPGVVRALESPSAAPATSAIAAAAISVGPWAAIGLSGLFGLALIVRHPKEHSGRRGQRRH